jgi:hypothetical protein
MAQYATMIKFDPQPRKFGSEWHVVATYPAGHKEHVMGFHSEEEALDWLASESCQAWLRGRGYAE